MVNFWGSWCAPCRAEADDLEATYQATKGAGVSFLGINVQDGRDKAKAFEEGRVTYPSLFDPAEPGWRSRFDVPPNTMPATMVLDRDGRIAAVIRAARSRRRAWSRSSSGSPPRSRRRRTADGRDLPRARPERAAAAGHRRGGARRAGQLPVPVRAAAGARLPVVRDRPGRRRPGGPRAPSRRTRAPTRRAVCAVKERVARVGAVKGRVLAGTLLFIAGFTVVFVATAILVASIGRVLLRLQARAARSSSAC